MNGIGDDDNLGYIIGAWLMPYLITKSSASVLVTRTV